MAGALIGAAVAAGAGYGYVDRQEAELRRSMEGTGVQVQRQGDNINLVMPGNITFATNSADIASNFYTPLNNLANSFKQYDQNSIEIVGHTDSTGSHQYNVNLSQLRAQSVANYLMAQGVNGARLSSRGMGRPAGGEQRHRGRPFAEPSRGDQADPAAQRPGAPATGLLIPPLACRAPFGALSLMPSVVSLLAQGHAADS